MLPCLIAAWQVPVAPCASQPASTLVTVTLAGLKGRITSLTTRGRFFLVGVGALFVLSRPGYFNERLATGVLRAACGRSFRFFARVFLAFSTLGAARAAIFAAALTPPVHRPVLSADGQPVRGVRDFSAARVAPLRCVRGVYRYYPAAVL